MEVCEELRAGAAAAGAALVGAHHVTCSDETERECIDVFYEGFVKPLLPTLKLSQQADFRTANLGSRYEWGSVRIAEHHFATRETAESFKLMLVKINAHASRDETDDGPYYGRLDRYQEVSDCCGALFALMAGKRLPAVDEIREVFTWEGRDRLGALTNGEVVPEPLRGLASAMVQARLQARAAMVDIRDHRPHTPTLYLVVPCVTINIPDLDGEMVCGLYTADYRTETPVLRYVGLGDNPAAYRIRHVEGRLVVTDPGSGADRPVRDHRREPLRTWLKRQGREEEVEPTEAGARAAPSEDAGERLERMFRRLAEAAPVETALRLFASGLAPIQHVYRADRISRNPAAAWEAMAILEDVREGLGSLAGDGACFTAEQLERIGLMMERTVQGV